MSIGDELRKLQDLRISGALTDEEFAAAKAAVIARGAGEGDPASEPGMHAHLEEIALQNEVAQLDREWALERERYMISGKYGHRSIPTRGLSVLVGVLVVGFGIFWTAMAASSGAPGFFPLIGVFFILVGAGASITSFTKAGAYEQAHDAYRRRRSQLLAGRDGKHHWEE
jgi:hypothetical protein